MLKCARKYGVALDVVRPARALREVMPIWYHPGLAEQQDTAKTAAATCLRARHGVTTVGQCVRAAQRLTHPDGTHRANPSCSCLSCVRDRVDLACPNPHRCAMAARKLVDRLHAKWQPVDRDPCDGLTLTRRRREENELAHDENGRIVFNPTLTLAPPLALAFWAFHIRETNNAVARRPPRPFAVTGEEVEVFTDCYAFERDS
ncbi:hypothetical protein GY45DRAFT_1264198 [Cubamyces sp. BRFM 1775]|nr:hypothetical protein GY45DRAFT_1264198 [Cubamyces sp. BRFM 1775]